MKRNSWIVLCVVLCLAFSACHGGDGSDKSGVLPPKDRVEEVFVGAGIGMSRETFTGTSEEEKKAILDKLYEADLTGLQDADPVGIMGPMISFKLRANDEEKIVEIILADEVQYLSVKNEEQQLFKKGTADTFAYQELSQLVSEVMQNQDDPNYSGKVRLTDQEDEQSINKGNTAAAKDMLDHWITRSEPVEDGEDKTYNVLFTVGETSYGISSDTRYFFRQEEGEKVYAQMDEQQLELVTTILGVLSKIS